MTRIKIPEKLKEAKFKFILLKKKEKIPIEKEWPTKKNYFWDNPTLQNHIKRGGNYGVIGDGNHVIIDADAEELKNILETKLPETFTVESPGSKGWHCYFLSNLNGPIRLKNNNNQNIGDIQGIGKQVVGPSCIHPNGKEYKIVKDIPPKKISEEKIKKVFSDYIAKDVEIGDDEKRAIKEIKDRDKIDINITDVAFPRNAKRKGDEIFGIHPIHGSDTKQNFWVNTTKNSWHCFRCESGGGPLLWLAVESGFIDCSEAVPGRLRGDDFKKVLKIAQEKFPEKFKKIIRIEPEEPWRIAREEDTGFENILPQGHFISKYISLHSRMTDAYPDYHFASGLFLLSMAMGRKAVVKMTTGKIHMNLWIFLLGKSTVSRKSTAINLAKILIEGSDLEDSLLPDDFTPEALVKFLADTPYTGFLRDEVGDFLSRLKRQYQLGLDAFLCKMYDCPPSYKRKLKKEEYLLEDIYMPMLWATTPKQFADFSMEGHLETGLFPRMLFIWPQRKKESKDLRIVTTEEEKKRMKLEKWLKDIYNAFGSSNTEIVIGIDEEALKIFNKWVKDYETYLQEKGEDESISLFFGRLSTNVIKMAVLFEIGDSSQIHIIHKFTNSHNTQINNSSFGREKGGEFCELGNFVVHPQSMKIAIYYASNFFIPTALRVINVVRAYEEENKLEKIYDLAVQYGGGGRISHKELLHRSHMKSKDFRELVETLVESERFVKEIEENPNGRDRVFYIPIIEKSKVKKPKVEKPILEMLSEVKEKP